jgi:hypothetical protein
VEQLNYQYLNLGYAAITLQQGASLAITPQTVNYLGNNQTYETSGYACTISDVRLLNTFTGLGINTEAAISANIAHNNIRYKCF